MTMDRDSRVLRAANVLIALGCWLMVTLMMAVPRDGPGSYFSAWLGSGAIWFAIGTVAILWGAPSYIRGRRRP